MQKSQETIYKLQNSLNNLELNKHKFSSKQYLDAFNKILLLRRFEEKCAEFYGQRLIGGFCHLYIGQEAIVTAVCLAKQASDSMITSYRAHAHVILAGTHPKYVFSELMGRASGCSKGKGGSMHLFNPEGKFYGGHGIVGAQVPIGAGLAFAEKYRNSNNIVFTFLGDGAVNQGQFYEALNMAALWKLPVIFVIENNKYSMGTSVERSTAVTDLYLKGLSVGVPGVQADGMNAESLYSVVKELSDFVRKDGGPVILEALSYRYKGHSMSDPATYRSKDEVSQFKSLDPLILIKEQIIAKSIATQEELKQIEKKINDEIMQSAKFALEDSLPNEEELFTDVNI